MVEAQGPQWKAFAKMQAKQRLAALLAELGYDAATSGQIEEAFLADIERRVDALLAAMAGQRPAEGTNMVDWMGGLPEKLSPELERDVALLLGDGEMGRFRDAVTKAHEKQAEELVDMQVNMMGLTGLTETQRQQVRAVVREQDPMKDQFQQFTELTQDRAKLNKLIETGEGLAEHMEKSMAPRRERMRQILTPEQFEQYGRYEKTMVQQAEMGIKMLQAMSKKPAADR
jgi:Spy/CpxP family protein refolding chaperone